MSERFLFGMFSIASAALCGALARKYFEMLWQHNIDDASTLVGAILLAVLAVVFAVAAASK